MTQVSFLGLGDGVKDVLEAEGGEVLVHDGLTWVQFPLGTKEIRDQERFEHVFAKVDNYQEACSEVPPYAWELPSGKMLEESNNSLLIWVSC